MIFVMQDELSTDLCLNALNADFLDNVLLGNDVVRTVNNSDFDHSDCTVTDAYLSDHMYSRSHSDSTSERQSSCSPPSIESHASLYSYSSRSPLADISGLENSSAASPSEFCASPLEGTMEDMTVQGILTVVEPTVVLLQGDDIIDMVAGCNEAVTDDSGLISVGRQQLMTFFDCLFCAVQMCILID